MKPLSFCAALAMAVLSSSASAALQPAAPVLETYAANGAPSSGPCSLGDVSRDGRFVGFSCASGDILRGESSPYSPYLLDRQTRQVQSLLVGQQGEILEAGGGAGFVSEDGRYAVFSSEWPLHPDVAEPPFTDLVPRSNVYLRDVVNGVTELLVRDIAGQAARPFHGTYPQAVSFSHKLVVFGAAMNLLDPAQPWTGNTNHLYLRNWQSGALELVNARPDGSLSGYDAYSAALSANGRYVAFNSRARDLGDENPTGTMQLFVRDRQLGTTRRISVPAAGGEFVTPYYQSGSARFSGDGGSLVLATTSEELAPGGAPVYLDAYRVDLATRRFELLSGGHAGAAPDNSTFSPDISDDGRYVAFYSRASNLLPTPQLRPAVYVKDLLTGEIVNVSEPLGVAHPTEVPRVLLAGDGSSVLFEWRHPDGPGVYGRVLIYSVALRGAGPAAPLPVPGLGSAGLLLLGAALVLTALLAGGAALSRRVSA